MKWFIRPAEERDVVAITAIYNEAVAAGFQTADISPVSVSSRLDWLRVHVESNLPVLVALCDDEVVGWISLSSYRPGREALRFTMEVSYYVEKSFRRKGVASQLLEAVTREALSRNFKVMFAIVLDRNLASVKLLERSGFEKWGFLPDVAVFDGGTCGHLYFGKLLTKD